MHIAHPHLTHDSVSLLPELKLICIGRSRTWYPTPTTHCVWRGWLAVVWGTRPRFTFTSGPCLRSLNTSLLSVSCMLFYVLCCLYLSVHVFFQVSLATRWLSLIWRVMIIKLQIVLSFIILGLNGLSTSKVWKKKVKIFHYDRRFQL